MLSTDRSSPDNTRSRLVLQCAAHQVVQDDEDVEDDDDRRDLSIIGFEAGGDH